jgi:hypothetical protein
MLLYIIYFFILLLIFIYIYIKLKYKFWSLQPVVHFYDIYYIFFNIGIINKNLPKINKYVNLKNIITKKYNIDELNDTNNYNLRDMINLIQCHYYKNKDNKENIYNPTKINIIPYFKGHNMDCFFTYYYNPSILLDINTNKTINNTELIGVITSRPMNVYLYNNFSKNYISFYVYYVDYLCVKTNFRGQNIAPQLIQTHEYNQSYMNKNICVSLFKREDELTSIIPITYYDSYCFQSNNWKNQPLKLPLEYNLVYVDTRNIYYLYNLILNNKELYKLIIIPNISNTIELIKTKNLFIIMILYNNEFIASYIFKKTCTYININNEILSCICSIQTPLINNEYFIIGFKNSIYKILNSYNNFSYVVLENCGSNNIIINNILLKNKPFIVSQTAYFFYNFAYSTIPSNKVFIFN